MEGINKNKKGFTLVECMVAVSIFTLSILGLLVLLGSSMVSATYTKNKMVATYLAQEGVEYIRNLKETYVLFDSSGIPATGWAAFSAKLTAGSCNTANGCYFDDQSISYASPSLQALTTMTVAACSNATCSNAPLRYNSTTGKYNYVVAGGTVSPYTRVIKLISISATEAKFTSTVRWTQPSGTYTVSFSENLSNWVE